MKKVSFILIPLAFLLAFCVQADKGTASVNSSKNSDSFPLAPEFTIEDLKGNSISLKDFDNKVIVLNFWATWCPPCKSEIPGFIEAYTELKDKGLEIIGISLDQIGAEGVLEFSNDYKINYPVAMATEEIYEAYKPGQYIPASIIIDRNGRIRHRHVGFLDKATLIKYFQDLNSE